jgi:selenocysteine lyase/cysteine desulfurase
MKQHRRNFLRQFGRAAGLAAAVPVFVPNLSLIKSALHKVAHLSAADCAEEEEFWYLIRQAYSVSPAIINLNNGGVSPQPRVVQEAVEHYNRMSNEAPSYYMWRILDRGREALRERLARFSGCSPEEVAINRNASEALETIIFGLRLKAGDEVVLTRQDYPNMINAWKQREHRDGVALKWLSFDFPIEDDDAITQKFVSAFTEKTKVVHITHVINWNGQVLPVKKIARAARERGIEVLVDGAHSYSHLNYRIDELGCDYFGTSLHKWLCAPFGSGMLYVRREKIKNLYPLFAGTDPTSDQISKFEHLGTRSFAIEQAIGHAIEFQEMVGAERKQKRLHFLKNYWAEQLIDLPGFQLHTSLDPRFAGAIALFSIEGVDPGDIGKFLMAEHKIHTTTINWENLKGVRVSPNIYTMKSELDKLVEAIRGFIQSRK